MVRGVGGVPEFSFGLYIIYNQIYFNQKVAVNNSAVQSYAVISTNHKTNCTVLQSLSDTHNIHRGLQDYFITG